MEKSTKKKFSEYYNALSEREKVGVRDTFLEKTGLKYPTWYSKIKEFKFSKLEKAALSEICGVEFDGED